MARVLWWGDAGCHTGFATVTESIGNRLAAMGHEVSTLAVNYRGDWWPSAMHMYVPTLQGSNDIYGQGRIVEILDKVKPEAVVILNDPQIVLNFLIDNPWDTHRVLLHGEVPIITYLPIDGYNNPPVWNALGLATTRVAMSKFGQESMPGSELIYHGVDTETFHPMNKREAKKRLGYDPDRFLVLRADKNSIRKNYADTWRAMRPILRAHPDVDLHFHCTPNSGDGVNLKSFVSGDADIRDRLFFSANLGGFTGWEQDDLRALYSAADVFVSTSFGEGFGLTVAEALACGTPVVATDCSATTEVVGPGGIVVPPARPWTAPMGQEQMLPDVEGITRGIEALYSNRRLRRTLGEAGRDHVVKTFSWDVAARQFDDLISKVIQTSGDKAQPSPPEET